MLLVEATLDNLNPGDVVLVRGYGKPEGDKLAVLARTRGGTVVDIRKRTAQEIKKANDFFSPCFPPIDPDEILAVCRCNEDTGGGTGFYPIGSLWKVVE